MTRITQTQNRAHIACMHLEENGIIGYHQAVVSQLFNNSRGRRGSKR